MLQSGLLRRILKPVKFDWILEPKYKKRSQSSPRTLDFAYKPSTWAAVGAGLVGIGVMLSQTPVLIVGIAIAALGLIMRENGGS